jgi:hypothetical protein
MYSVYVLGAPLNGDVERLLSGTDYDRLRSKADVAGLAWVGLFSAVLCVA